MGLKEQFQKGAETIFKFAGNVPQNITYKVFTVGADDGMGGTVDPTFTDKTIQAFVFDYTQDEVQKSGLIKPETDKKVMIELRALALQGITVNWKDRMTIEGDLMKIQHKKKDPADAVFTFQMRKI